MENAKVETTYSTPFGLTQQFRFCGNPLRLDMYRNCSFQCNYCFAKSHGGTNKFIKQIDVADINQVKKFFEKAFESDTDKISIEVELLRKKVPIHIGGMSDPFQPLEFKLHLTKQVIELSNKYQVPLVFSTKQCYLPKEYFDILNPKLHAFQISLISDDENWLKKYEPNTPTPNERIAFMKELKSKGFWVSMRMQPLIDLQQAINVIKKVENIVDYVTVEHLKIATNDSNQQELFKQYLKDYYKPQNSRMFEMKTDKKEKDVLTIKSQVKCKIGVGDNDLHHLSDSNCCCGIDTAGDAFQTYLKYNLTYFVTSNCTIEESEKLYVPKESCSHCFMSDTIIRGVNQFKDYVDNYCAKNQDLIKHNCNLVEKYRNFYMNSEVIKKFEKNESKKDQMNIFDF